MREKEPEMLWRDKTKTMREEGKSHLRVCVCVRGRGEHHRRHLLLLTVGERAEEGGAAEAAVAGCCVRPHLHLVLRGPAQVGEHGLVRATLRVVALVLAAQLLRRGNTCEQRSSLPTNLKYRQSKRNCSGEDL